MQNRISFIDDRKAAVVVCGAGAAGMAAALSAAANGVDVYLVEAKPEIGGTVTHSLIHTLGGIFDRNGAFINEGLVMQLVDRLRIAGEATGPRQLGRTSVLNVRPANYGRVVSEWIKHTSNIRLLCAARILAVQADGGRAQEVTFQTPDGLVRLRCSTLVDATGSAEIVRMVDPDLVMDASTNAAGGLIFTLRHVGRHALDFPGGLRVLRALRAAAGSGLLPRECCHTWIDTGVDDDEVYVKLLVSPKNRCAADLTSEVLHTQRLVVQFLKDIPEFSNAFVEATGMIGVRDGGCICGEYCLTTNDVRRGRRFADVACRCSWPIEYWDSDRGVSLEYLESDYDIPLRALKLARFQNVWAAGKCLSADTYARASARVVGTCWAMGDAVGRAIVGKL